VLSFHVLDLLDALLGQEDRGRLPASRLEPLLGKGQPAHPEALWTVNVPAVCAAPSGLKTTCGWL